MLSPRLSNLSVRPTCPWYGRVSTLQGGICFRRRYHLFAAAQTRVPNIRGTGSPWQAVNSAQACSISITQLRYFQSGRPRQTNARTPKSIPEASDVNISAVVDKSQLLCPSKAFSRLPLRSGFLELMSQQLSTRKALRLINNKESDTHQTVLNPTMIQRMSFDHFLLNRDTYKHPPEVFWSDLFGKGSNKAQGFLFPLAPGTSTLLAGEAGGGKTLAYLLPLLQRLVETAPDNLQKELHLRATSSLQVNPDLISSSGEWDEDLDESEEVHEEGYAEDDWGEEVEDSTSILDQQISEQAEQEAATEDPNYIPDEDLADFEAFLKRKERSKGRFASQEQLEREQREALAKSQEVTAWKPSLKPERAALVYPRSVIIAPTHELARQIEATVKSLTYIEKLRTVCTSRAQWLSIVQHDIRLMTHGKWDQVRPIDVLVTTPERLRDLTVPLASKMSRLQSLHAKYTREGNVVAAEKVERYAEKANRNRLVCLDGVRAMVCDEADTLWNKDHYESTRQLVRAVHDERVDAWRKHVRHERNRAKGRELLPTFAPQVPADLIHVTASVGYAFRKELSNRFPGTKEVLSKYLHQVPPNVRVKYCSIDPDPREALIREVSDALLADPNDESRLLIVCEKKQTVEVLGKLLKNAGILNRTMTSESRDRGMTSHYYLPGFVLDPRQMLPPPTPKKGAREGTTTNEADSKKVASPAASEEGSSKGLKREQISRSSPVHDTEAVTEAELREEEKAILNGMDPLVYKKLKEKGLTEGQHENNGTIEETRSTGQSVSGAKGKNATSHSAKGAHEASKTRNFPRVLITTSNLTRGIDFTPLVTHVVIPDARSRHARSRAGIRVDPTTSKEYIKDTMDILHRAGRVGRGGVPATLLLFDQIDYKTGLPVEKKEDGRGKKNSRAPVDTSSRFKSSLRSVRRVKSHPAGASPDTTKRNKTPKDRRR